MIVNNKYRFIFFHNPKTGGSTVNHLLKNLEGHNEELSAGNVHMTPDTFFEQDHVPLEVHDYYRWTFVRNPWERMESCYHQVMRNNAKAQVQPFEFSTFIKKFYEGGSWPWLVKQRGTIFKPQHRWYADRSTHMYHFVEFEEELRDVALYLGFDLPDSIPRINEKPKPHSCVWDRTSLAIFEKEYNEDCHKLRWYKFQGKMEG